MIITLKIDNKFTEIGIIKEMLIALRFLSQQIQISFFVWRRVRTGAFGKVQIKISACNPKLHNNTNQVAIGVVINFDAIVAFEIKIFSHRFEFSAFNEILICMSFKMIMRFLDKMIMTLHNGIKFIEI